MNKLKDVHDNQFLHQYLILDLLLVIADMHILNRYHNHTRCSRMTIFYNYNFLNINHIAIGIFDHQNEMFYNKLIYGHEKGICIFYVLIKQLLFLTWFVHDNILLKDTFFYY